MDFDEHYTPEQLAFRAVVRAWLEAYLPGGLNIPNDGKPVNREDQVKLKEFRRQLGLKGWLAPSWPIEAGGAALPPTLEVIIQEELRRLQLPSLGDNRLWIAPMMVWGSDDQKRRFVGPALRGETITWMAFNEADSGTDLAAIKTRADRQGDEYVVNGSKAFITGRFDPDFLCTLAVTDPTRPARLNLGILMIDARLPGVSIQTPKLLTGSERFIFFDNVHVPADCLIGSPYLGWEIAQAMVGGERGEQRFRLNPRGTVESIKQLLKDEGERPQG